MKMSLQHLKGYVEEQLFVILGQMESSTKITDHLYLVCFIKHLLFFRSLHLARYFCFAHAMYYVCVSSLEKQCSPIGSEVKDTMTLSITVTVAGRVLVLRVK